MQKLTITEALAEIKTIGKRLAKKREFVMGFLARHEGIKDPHERDGGSYEVLKRERQGIVDLENRIVALRAAIRKANDTTAVTIEGVTRTISDWLTWRREVATGEQTFLAAMRESLKRIRADSQKSGTRVLSQGEAPQGPSDIIVNINERTLAEEIEKVESTLGALDGQLSLRNATTFVEL